LRGGNGYGYGYGYGYGNRIGFAEQDNG